MLRRFDQALVRTQGLNIEIRVGGREGWGSQEGLGDERMDTECWFEVRLGHNVFR